METENDDTSSHRIADRICDELRVGDMAGAIEAAVVMVQRLTPSN